MLSIKFVKRAKSTLFTFKFKLAIQKKIFRSKSTIEFFNLRQNAKVTVPITQLPFRQNLKFSNFPLCKKIIKFNFTFILKIAKINPKASKRSTRNNKLQIIQKYPKKLTDSVANPLQHIPLTSTGSHVCSNFDSDRKL